jgi:hypothetical protein
VNEERELAALLLRLELMLMEPAFRRDSAAVSALLAEGFLEFGSSGRVWSREAILRLLATEEQQPVPRVEDFTLRMLASDVALVTYRTVRPQQATLRSSIWRQGANGWQVFFHQGTKMPAAEPAHSEALATNHS